MIESINLNLGDFIEIFLLMLGSFLIGYGFAYYYFKKKYTNKSPLRVQDYNDDLDTPTIGEIKATKTFDRGGFEVIDNEVEDIEFFVDEDKNPKEASKSKKTGEDPTSNS